METEIKATDELAQKLSDCNVETLNVTELAIIASIRKGINTLSLIADETAIKSNIVKNVIDTLVNKSIIIQVPGADEDTFVLKVKSESGKKLKLGGNFLLPVSSFTDSEGQRWVCRGSWHKIESNIDILNDIEWFDNTDQETQMKIVMKSVSERKKKANEIKIKNDISTDGPAASEDELYQKKWNNISDTMKMYVYGVSASRASVGFAPRFITEFGEFPFGCISESTTITIEDYRKYIACENVNPTIDYNKIRVITAKNNFPAEIQNDGKIIRFFELKPNKGGDTIAASEKFITFTEDGKWSLKNGKNNSDVPTMDISKFIATECPLVDNFYKSQMPVE